MLRMQSTPPASLRRPAHNVVSPEFFQSKAIRPSNVASAEARASSLMKSRFALLPREPEDARMTGVTRSLDRRLLALNIGGSLIKSCAVPYMAGKSA